MKSFQSREIFRCLNIFKKLTVEQVGFEKPQDKGSLENKHKHFWLWIKYSKLQTDQVKTWAS